MLVLDNKLCESWMNNEPKSLKKTVSTRHKMHVVSCFARYVRQVVRPLPPAFMPYFSSFCPFSNGLGSVC